MDQSRILIVDDNEAGIEALSGILASEGYELVTASSGEEALHHVQKRPPDLILLDVMMPGMDGYEVCRRIREDPDLSKIPVVMVTALDDRASRLRGIEAGADDFVSKPVDRHELRARVRTITGLNRYRRLVDERTRVEQLIKLSPDGIAVVDQAGNVHLANPALQAILHVEDEDQLRGKPFHQFMADEDIDEWRRAIETVTGRLEGAVHLEATLLAPSGPRATVEISVGAFPLDDGPGAQLLIRDVTMRRRLEREVGRNERLDAIGKATAGVVHDFNNFLQAIRVNAELILRTLDEGSPALEDVRDIIAVTDQSAALTERLLTFARQGEVERRLVDLNEVVSSIQPLLERMTGRKVQLEVRLIDTALPVQGDQGQLEQMLVNLVVNAVDAVGEEGTIRVETDEIRPDDAIRGPVGRPSAVLRVSDDGMGMDEATQANVFEPFFTTKEEKGTGLGLSMVHGIVRSHDGTVSVESEVGVGTVFEIVLPESSV